MQFPRRARAVVDAGVLFSALSPLAMGQATLRVEVHTTDAPLFAEVHRMMPTGSSSCGARAFSGVHRGETAVRGVDGEGDVDALGVCVSSARRVLNDGCGRFTDASSRLDAVPVTFFTYTSCVDLGSTVLRSLTRQVAWRSLPRKPLVPRERWVLRGSKERLDASTVFFVASGTLHENGHAEVTSLVPDDPTLEGTTDFWQAEVGSRRNYTNIEATTFSDL